MPNMRKIDIATEKAAREEAEAAALHNPDHDIPDGNNNGMDGLRLAITQEAAQADEFISVKLVGSDGITAYGDAFDAEFDFVDGATAANLCTPQIQTGKTIHIRFAGNKWRVVYPTVTSVGTPCPEE